MPKRTDIKSVLIIGAGPIIIGQACEFDYSGVQACKALREEGYKVILVNSNPATIMTDPGLADATYIEPITWQSLEKIIKIEKPDAILPTMGGQTGLNVALRFQKSLYQKIFQLHTDLYSMALSKEFLFKRIASLVFKVIQKQVQDRKSCDRSLILSSPR